MPITPRPSIGQNPFANRFGVSPFGLGPLNNGKRLAQQPGERPVQFRQSPVASPTRFKDNWEGARLNSPKPSTPVQANNTVELGNRTQVHFQNFLNAHKIRLQDIRPNKYGFKKIECGNRAYFIDPNNKIRYRGIKDPGKQGAFKQKMYGGADEAFVGLVPKKGFRPEEHRSNRDLEKLNIKTAIPNIIVEDGLMLARNAGKPFSAPINIRAFQALVEESKILLKNGIFFRDIKSDNMVFDEKNQRVNSIDINDRIQMTLGRPYIGVHFCDPGFSTDGLIKGTYSHDPITQYHHFRAADEYALMLAMIVGTTKDSALKQAALRPNVDSIHPNSGYPGAMNSKNAQLFRNWINENIRREFRPLVEGLLSNPAHIAKTQPNRAYVADMLKITSNPVQAPVAKSAAPTVNPAPTARPTAQSPSASPKVVNNATAPLAAKSPVAVAPKVNNDPPAKAAASALPIKRHVHRLPQQVTNGLTNTVLLEAALKKLPTAPSGNLNGKRFDQFFPTRLVGDDGQVIVMPGLPAHTSKMLPEELSLFMAAKLAQEKNDAAKLPSRTELARAKADLKELERLRGIAADQAIEERLNNLRNDISPKEALAKKTIGEIEDAKLEARLNALREEDVTDDELWERLDRLAGRTPESDLKNQKNALARAKIKRQKEIDALLNKLDHLKGAQRKADQDNGKIDDQLAALHRRHNSPPDVLANKVIPINVQHLPKRSDVIVPAPTEPVASRRPAKVVQFAPTPSLKEPTLSGLSAHAKARRKAQQDLDMLKQKLRTVLAMQAEINEIKKLDAAGQPRPSAKVSTPQQANRVLPPAISRPNTPRAVGIFRGKIYYAGDVITLANQPSYKVPEPRPVMVEGKAYYPGDAITMKSGDSFRVPYIDLGFLDRRYK
ncbi:MAG: hypothetical protein IT497_01505 [Ottowia sp.]|nr:hypothetical protein [Ottowia sp.]